VIIDALHERIHMDEGFGVSLAERPRAKRRNDTLAYTKEFQKRGIELIC
jgi:hypothetical protein